MEDKSDKLIILDLDETLIYANQNALGIPCDFKVDKYFVYKRPYLEQLLTAISKHFSIGICSSADADYVNEMLQHIKPASIDLSIVWGRSKCSLKRDPVFDTYCYEKRLDKLKKKGFRLEQILLVDDSPSKARTNYGNAIYIKEFTGNQNDHELLFLYDYLLTLRQSTMGEQSRNVTGENKIHFNCLFDGIGNAVLSGKLAAAQAIHCFAADSFSAAFMKQYETQLYQAAGADMKRKTKVLKTLARMPFLFDALFTIGQNRMVKNWMK